MDSRDATKNGASPDEIREFADAIFIVLSAYAGSMSHSVASVEWALDVVNNAVVEVSHGISTRIS